MLDLYVRNASDRPANISTGGEMRGEHLLPNISSTFNSTLEYIMGKK